MQWHHIKAAEQNILGKKQHFCRFSPRSAGMAKMQRPRATYKTTSPHPLNPPVGQSHTSSPSSSTTGFKTLIFFPSEAMVRDCVRYRDDTPDQREAAAAETRDLAGVWGDTEVEEEIERKAGEEKEKEEERGGAAEVRSG